MKVIFVFATEIDESTVNILSCYFLQQTYALSHQTKYLHIKNQICLSQTVFFSLLTSKNALKTQTDQSTLSLENFPRRKNRVSRAQDCAT